MHSILFVCHGNICRSPMAQSFMQYLVESSFLSDKYTIDSGATSTEEIGSLPHRGTVKILAEHGIPLVEHRARQISKKESSRWDLIIGMDDENIKNICKIIGKENSFKVHKMLEWKASENSLGKGGQVPDVQDPWYTGDFNSTWDDISQGCISLFKALEEKDRLS